MARPKKRGRNPAADLTDDLVVEILSRLPAKSVCHFKCVSRRWRRRLIGHPDYRAKLPQTLSGFFRDLDTLNEGHGTISSTYILISDEEDDGDDFSGYRSVVPKSCSNGLLLCLCWKIASTTESDYVVCNPATQQWMTVPGSGQRYRTLMRMHLAAAASGHFHVFALLPDEFLDGYLNDVDIYSSETGAWSHHESAWEDDVAVFPRSVFHHGMLHLVTVRLSCDQSSTIVAVDTEGKTWRTIPLLESMDSGYPYSSNGPFIGVSQGRLQYVNHRRRDQYTLSVWIRGGGDDDDQWIFRYSIRSTGIFGGRVSDLEDYSLVGIHPECNTVYFGLKRRRKCVLLSYDMDRGIVRVLIRNIRSSGWSETPYLP
ncbi:unnamed protein product [Alopecurus aequalis]